MRGYLILLWLLFSVRPIFAQELPDYFVEVEVSNPTPYIGQQIVYAFRLYSRVPNWTDTGLLAEPAFDGFWLEELDVERYQVVLEGRAYRVRARKLTLFPTQAGTITIDPMRFIIPDDPIKAGEVLTSDPVTVDVQPLPEADDSSDFNGAVGQFELIPTIDRQSATVGEPIRLELTVRGNGNLAQMPVPEIPESPVWRSYVNPSRYQSRETDEGQVLGEITYSWLLTPLVAGNQTLPELSLTYFDPSTASYQTLSTTPVTVEVLPGENTEIVVTRPAEAAALTLRPVPTVLSTGLPQIPGWTWILWLVAPLMTLVIWLRVRHLEHRRRYASLYRYSEALKQAHGLLAQARKQPASAAYRLSWEAIMNYFGDKLDETSAVLNYDDVETAMDIQGIKPELAALVLESLQRSDQARYAPFAVEDVRSHIDDTARILARVDQVWA